MSATLHLAPIGHDKSALTISLLRDYLDARKNDFPTVWVLLATRRQELRFRQRLIEAEGSPPAFFNIECFNFYSLNTRLLKIAGAPVRRLSSQMRHKILRSLLAQMLENEQLKTFHRIAETRGFITVLAELIDELKQNSIDVADFAQAARSPKDKEIAAIYQRYQDTLRRSELADIEGEGWLALATLRRQIAIAAHVDMLLVDGYDQFTPVQSNLLAQLARAIDHVHITLTALPDEPGAPLPSRSALARKGLQEACAAAGASLHLRKLDAAPSQRDKNLHHLGQAVFRDTPAGSGNGAVNLIAMPDPAEEARAVLRAVKRLLLKGAPADSILIALRDWERYAPYFEAGRAEYALPLLLHYESSYSRAPVIAALVSLLDLAPRFRRRDLLDSLRSPYFDSGLQAAQVDLLDRVSQERQFPGGPPSAWRALIRQAAQPISDDRADEALTVIPAGQARALDERLSAFLAAIAPPERAKLPAYVHWLEALLGIDPASEPQEKNCDFSLNITLNAWKDDQANRALVARDINAMTGLQAILRDMLASDEVLKAITKRDRQTTWRDFWSDLKQALDASADTTNQPRKQQVLVATAAAARGLTQDHVFILGLAEGVFPAEVAEDPLYLDSEREQLQNRGIPLATRAERIDDRGLFYELIGLPRKTLTLSRPTYQAGKAWIESYFWRAVRAVFPDAPIMSRPLGAVIPPDEAASSAELMLAVAAQLGQPDAASAEAALRARNWLRAQPNYASHWRQLEKNRAVELGRMTNAPFDQFSGILARPATQREAARQLSPQRVFSASRLKDYGLCGFRYFAKRLLKLEEALEPEAGADSMQLGTLNHSILEETYKRIAQVNLQIHADNLPSALEIFYDVSAKILATAPTDFNFSATATWEAEKQMLVKRLAALIKLDFSPKSPLNRFGSPRTAQQMEQEFQDLPLPMPDALSPLRVSGVIDRIDLADEQLVIVDYKTGSTVINRSEMETGRDFQMLIYVEALAKLLEEQGDSRSVAGGLFWHLRNLKPSGLFSTDNEDDLAALAQAKAHIARNLQMGRAGQFPARAAKLENGKCIRYCEFSHLCRMRVTGHNKPLPAETT